MMLTPCGPSAVPTGGAGVALPAGICSFTCPVTFFAIGEFLFLQMSLCSLFDLQEVEFHRGGAAENGHQHAQRVALRIDLVHLARKTAERPIDDAHVLAL